MFSGYKDQGLFKRFWASQTYTQYQALVHTWDSLKPED
uniref:Uncharacterized protein n=1 Tax=Rhizophora mucronata TaxID=61149 RepID=A0A2P2Q5Q1_RHIMU